jgi:hypothetical protein
MHTFTLLRRLGPVVACGVLAAGATACGSGSGSEAKPPSRPATTSAAATTAPATTPATGSVTGPVTTTAGPSPSGQLAGVEQQLAAVPGLLQQAQSANSAADPDQARAAEGG